MLKSGEFEADKWKHTTKQKTENTYFGNADPAMRLEGKMHPMLMVDASNGLYAPLNALLRARIKFRVIAFIVAEGHA